MAMVATAGMGMATASNLLRSRIPLSIRTFRVLPVVGLIGAVWSAHAQTGDTTGNSGADARNGRAFVIVPRVSVNELATTNVALQGAGKLSDLVTTISPGVQIRSDAGRLKGYFDYSLNQLLYANDSSRNSTQNALNTFGSYEAVSNFAFVDFSGAITQQSISAFGPQTENNQTVNSNRTETSTFRLSPYLRGKFGSLADYQVRYSRSLLRSKSSSASNSDVEDITGSLSGENGSRKLGWSVDASRQTQEFSQGTQTEADRLRGVLTYVVVPQFKVSAIGGQESNNYVSLNKQSHTNLGTGFNWALGERTSLSAQIERRFFGTGHSISFEHRSAHTAWRFTDSKDVSVAAQPSSSISPLYDLLFSQFASIEPDPAKRAQLVQNYLQTNNLNGQTNVPVGFLASGVSLQSRQDLSFTVLGLRDTVTVLATRSKSSRLLASQTGQDDLAISSFVQQQGISASYSHRLTPESNVNLIGSLMRTSGDATTQSSTLKSLNINFSTRVGLRTTATLGARRVLFDSATTPYNESAVLGSLSVRF